MRNSIAQVTKAGIVLAIAACAVAFASAPASAGAEEDQQARTKEIVGPLEDLKLPPGLLGG